MVLLGRNKVSTPLSTSGCRKSSVQCDAICPLRGELSDLEFASLVECGLHME